MKKKTSQSKMLARKALLGNYGVASGALLLAWLMNLAVMMAWRSGVLVVDLFLPPRSLGMAGHLMAEGIRWLVSSVGGMILMTGEFHICHEICAGRRTRVSELFFVLFTHPFGFAGLWLVFVLAALVAMAPGGMFFVLATIAGRPLKFSLEFTGVVVCVLLQLAVLFWVLGTLTAVLDSLEEEQAGLEQGGWRTRECMGAGWRFLVQEGWQLVKLCPGFLGLFFLGTASLGLGYLWVIPYLFSTVIHLYWIHMQGDWGTVWERDA